MPAFLLTPAFKIALIAAIFLLWSGWLFKKGYDYKDQEDQAAITQQAIRTVKVVVERERIKRVIVEKLIEVKVHDEAALADIKKEVPDAVKTSHCNVSLRFVRMWNDAVNLSPSEPSTGGADDARSELTCADFAAWILEAAGAFAENKARLEAWQEWARKTIEAEGQTP